MEVSKNDWQDSLSKIRAAKEASERGDYGKTLDLANQALEITPNDPLALFLVAYAMMKFQKFIPAYHLFMKCVELEPGRAGHWNNAGFCLLQSYRTEEGEMCFRESLKRDPSNPIAMQNMALIYLNKGQPKEALKWLRKANSEGQGYDDTKSMALLALRQWKEGWALYRKTAGWYKERKILKYCNPEEPDWNGEKGSVVISGNQGVGDEIAYASCIPDAMKRADVIIDTLPKLQNLFKRSFPEAKVYASRNDDSREWDHPIDYSLPIDCLPSLFRNSDEEFPGTPYLIADPERRLQWRALFDTFKKPVIGIAWSGGLINTGKVKRSLPLEAFLPILKAVDATWVSLEYLDRSEQIEDLETIHGVKILDYPRATQTNDYDDTAALVAELDLVITVTTAVVHLSGALGKECWCLAPKYPRFFYGLEGDIPWYKSVKMFRQDKEWPIKDIAKLLKLRYGCR